MKVLLVSANVTRSPYPVYPLGMSQVAAALHHAGHQVRQIDLLQKGLNLDVVGQEAQSFAPGLIGISVRNIDNVNLLDEQRYINGVGELVRQVRQTTGAKILLGGAGFSLMPERILEETGGDYGIVGEGDIAAVGFVKDVKRGVWPASRLIRAVERVESGRIGSALYDEEILAFYRCHGNIVPVQTKRGCSCRCAYCTYPILEGSNLRLRDPKAVVDDIEFLARGQGSRYLYFVDSVFNDDEGAYLEVVAEMERRSLSVPWTGLFRPGGMTDALIERMKKTGFVAAEVGADAACDATLRGLGKSFTFRDVQESHKLFIRHGIVTSYFFMFGGPGETPETVLQGIRNIGGLHDSVAVISMGIRILPGTLLARRAIAEGLIAPTNDLFEPVYYLSPTVDRGWLERTLIEAFAGAPRCVFPPNALDASVAKLHMMGYTGPLGDVLLRYAKPRDRQGLGSEVPVDL